MESRPSVFKNIWIADDDNDDQLVFEHALKEIDSSVNLTTFDNSEELLTNLKLATPDLLFLDINMPCINGKECLKLIKEDLAYTELRVVMFSGSSAPLDIAASYGYGATLYVVKPSTYDRLVSIISNILGLNWDNPSSITDSQYVNNRFVPFSVNE